MQVISRQAEGQLRGINAFLVLPIQAMVDAKPVRFGSDALLLESLIKHGVGLTFRRAGALPSDGYAVQLSVSSWDPGEYSLFESCRRAALLRAQLRVSGSDGRSVEVMQFEALANAGIHQSDETSRLRAAVEDMGARIARYLKERTAGTPYPSGRHDQR